MKADEMRAQALAARVPGLLMVVGSDVVAALDDERRQTQRRMIAALYWLAGACFLQSDMARSRAGAEVYGALALTPMRYSLEQHSCGMAHWSAANAMERAL